MKRIIGILLVVVVIFTLSACSPAKKGGEVSSEEKPGSKEEEITIILGHNQAPDTPQDVAHHYFKKLVEERSNGKVKVKIYPAMQLGAMREQAESTQAGTIHITEQPVAVLSTFAPEIAILELPYLWTDPQIGYKILDGPIGQEILADLEKHGFKGLGYTTAGMRHVTANKEINLPSDLKGLKFRVMPAPILMDMVRVWGAEPTPIEFGELYTALQQGTVDAQENPLQTIEMVKIYEVQDYINLTNHIHFIYGIVANLEWFNNLPSDIQELIVEARKEANEYQRKVLHEREGEYLRIIKESGTIINEISEEDLAVWRETSMKLHEMYADKLGRDRLERIYKEVEKLEQSK